MDKSLSIPESLDLEDLIQASLDYNGGRYSAWQMWRVLARNEFYSPAQETSLVQTIRACLLDNFEKTYGAKIATRDIVIDPRLPPLQILVLEQPGSLSVTYPAGSPLILELPTRRAFDSQWIRFQASSVPFAVRLHGALATNATGTAKALVWIVADTGEISEFQQLPPEAGLASRAIRTSGELLDRVESDTAPDPGDEDTEHAYIAEMEERQKTGQTPIRKTLSEGSDEVAIVKRYIEERQFQREADAAAAAAKRSTTSAKRAVETLMKDCDELVLPDGRTLVPSIGRRAPAYNQGSKWVNLDVAEAAGTDTNE